MFAARLIFLVFSLALLPRLAEAAPLARDLGAGLIYVRVRELPGDLPTQPAGPAPACVVDVRYAPADRDVASAFSAWLKFRATVRSPVFVLANRETSVELRRVIREPHRGTGIVVIGIAGPDFEPDVAVRSTPENEKLAYEALGKETPLSALLADHPDKLRNDEARLARPSAPPPEDEPADTAKPGSPGVDATLQRAVHLHRSLVALRRNQGNRGGG